MVARLTANRAPRPLGLRLAVLVVTVLWAGFCHTAAFRAFGWVGVGVLVMLAAMFGLVSHLAADRWSA